MELSQSTVYGTVGLFTNLFLNGSLHYFVNDKRQYCMHALVAQLKGLKASTVDSSTHTHTHTHTYLHTRTHTHTHLFTYTHTHTYTHTQHTHTHSHSCNHNGSCSTVGPLQPGRHGNLHLHCQRTAADLANQQCPAGH